MTTTPNHGRDSFGRFAKGNNFQQLKDVPLTNLKHALLQLASPELITTKMMECLDSERDRMTALTLLLAYTLGKPKESIELTTNQGTMWNVSTLNPEEQAALQALALKSLGGESPLIEAEFTPVKDKAIRVQT